MTRGWLVAQLPRAMAQDPLLSGLVGLLEEIANTLRDDVDAVEQHLDPATASAPMLRYLASWVGAELDPKISIERQREVLRATGPLIGRRGTRRGLEDLLSALTGGRASVTDSGGVYPSRAPRPAMDLRVVVEVEQLGELDEPQLLALIRAEVPAGTRVELRTPSARAGTVGPPRPEEGR